MRIENRPSSDVNFAHERLLALGTLLGVDVLGGSFGGRSVCSCALKEALNPSVIDKASKNLFIKVPFVHLGDSGPRIITH